MMVETKLVAKLRDALARRYCRGWAVASEEYRRDLKKIYAQLEEPGGWGGPEVSELGKGNNGVRGQTLLI